MTNREAIEILGELKKCYLGGIVDAIDMAIEAVKAQEPATVEPNRIELADETKEWLDKMDAVDALGNIANICIDWDGYRTADGLGGLINEIWAYARYCASRLLKAQEPRVMTLEEVRQAEINSEPLWCEFIDCAFGSWRMGWMLKTQSRRELQHVIENHFERAIVWESEYGISWRCWTSRPTDEQREAIPWN